MHTVQCIRCLFIAGTLYWCQNENVAYKKYCSSKTNIFLSCAIENCNARRRLIIKTNDICVVRNHEAHNHNESENECELMMVKIDMCRMTKSDKRKLLTPRYIFDTCLAKYPSIQLTKDDRRSLIKYIRNRRYAPSKPSKSVFFHTSGRQVYLPLFAYSYH